MYGKFSNRFFFPLLLGLCIFLVFNRHSKSKFDDYHSVNWADAGGYYVYLPATFIYGFDAKHFPDRIDHKSGDGFHLDEQSGIVHTKYNYGVALLQLPFFLIAHSLSSIADVPSDGYNSWYYRFIMICGVVYMILGLSLVRNVLRQKGLSHGLSDLVILFLLTATNIFYYGINSPGFSHVYSFFLFALFISLTGRYYQDKTWKNILLLALIFALAVLVRLTNGLILLYFVFYQLGNIQERFRELFSGKVVFTFSLLLIIVFIPQLIYWKYASGSLISDMYGNEGFNFFNPHVKEILFSPFNGLFPYTPVVLFFLLVSFYLSFKKNIEALGVTIMMLSAIYVFASWYSWTYGCSYGSRPFSEYLAFLILPFAIWVKDLKKSSRSVVLTLCFIFSIFNINTIYHYDGCWYGGIWDWEEYFRIILR